MEQYQNQQSPEIDQQPAAPQGKIPYPMMSFGDAVQTCFRKFIDFKGRARRSEFWWFFLFGSIVSSGTNVLSNLGGLFLFIGLLITLVMLVPLSAAMTRRLHDTGRSGWWVVAAFVCILVDWIAFSTMFSSGDILMMLAGKHDPAMQPTHYSLVATWIAFVTGVCGVFLSIFALGLCINDSQVDENKYGPSPKYK